jgi:ABC-type lipoprotein release transport system permease subunit
MQRKREIVSVSTAPCRFQMMLIVAFAVLSLALAVVGVYGVASYSVARQTQEIGLHMALGAQQRDILISVLAHGLRPVTVGLVPGLAVAAVAAASIRTLSGIEPLGPVSLVGVPLILLLAPKLACYLPARRASCVDPVIVLRSE